MKTSQVIKGILIAILSLTIGIVVFISLIFMNIQRYTKKYSSYNSDDGDSITIIEKKVNLGMTNYICLTEWSYSEGGVLFLNAVDHSNAFQIIKIENNYADFCNVFSISFDVTRQLVKKKEGHYYYTFEWYMDSSYFYRISYILDQTKRDVKSLAFHGKILDTLQENTEKYRIRLFYSEVQQIGLLEKPGKYKTALMIFKFDLTDEFIPMDIAFIENKTDPKNLYIVIAVDRNIGENHSTVRKFIKSYFNISVPEKL